MQEININIIADCLIGKYGNLGLKTIDVPVPDRGDLIEIENPAGRTFHLKVTHVSHKYTERGSLTGIQVLCENIAEHQDLPGVF